MHLRELLDVGLLEKHVEAGLIDKRLHNSLPLSIYCYSKQQTFASVWDEVLEICRGLIVDEITGEVVARPFRKFFNLNYNGRPETEVHNLLARGNPRYHEKLDGSMGTLWHYKGHMGVATKGSFHSEQANWATEWLAKHQLSPGAWPVGFTPIFEIIAQSVQHHVVHYLPSEDNRLVLTALINIETGAEMEPEQMRLWASINSIDVVDIWNGESLSFYDAMIKDRPGKEGYVATWYRNGQTPFRVKIKHKEFLKLQKIAHHTTPKTVFQALRNGDRALIDEAVQFGSPFLASKVKDWVTIYQDEHDNIILQARELFKTALTCTTGRKEFAEFVISTNKALSAAAFNLLDEKEIHLRETAWDMVEPLVKTIKYDEVEDLG